MTELLLFGPQKIAVVITGVGGGWGLRQDPLYAKMITTTTTTSHYTLLGMYIYQRNTNNCPY